MSFEPIKNRDWRCFYFMTIKKQWSLQLFTSILPNIIALINLFIITFMKALNLRFAFSTLRYNKKKDYYKILEITKTASTTEIKSAYIKLAKKHHPDLNKGKETDIFKEVNEANQVLSNSQLRKQYERDFNQKQQNDQEQKTYKKYGFHRRSNGKSWEGYTTYQYPEDFQQWFRGQKRQKYKRPQETTKKRNFQNNPNWFSSNSKQEDILNMHYEMGRAYEAKQKQQKYKDSPTFEQELLKAGNGLKKYSKDLWQKFTNNKPS